MGLEETNLTNQVFAGDPCPSLSRVHDVHGTGSNVRPDFVAVDVGSIVNRRLPRKVQLCCAAEPALACLRMPVGNPTPLSQIIERSRFCGWTDPLRRFETIVETTTCVGGYQQNHHSSGFLRCCEKLCLFFFSASASICMEPKAGYWDHVLADPCRLLRRRPRPQPLHLDEG